MNPDDNNGSGVDTTSGSSPIGMIVGGVIGAGLIIGIGAFAIKKRKEKNGGSLFTPSTPRDKNKKDKQGDSTVTKNALVTTDASGFKSKMTNEQRLKKE